MKDKYKSIFALLGCIIATYVLFRVLQPTRFGSVDSILMVFKQAIIPSVAACGYFFAWIIGLFDLSMGANIILSALIGCLLSTKLGYLGLFIGCIVTGLAVGFINATIIQKLKIPSVVATVGTLIIYECIGYYITIVAGGTNSLTLDASLRMFGTYPWNLILSGICFVIVYVLYKYSRLGLYCNAIGSNRTMTEDYGINVERWIYTASMVGGLFIGIMALLAISYGSTFTPSLNMESFKRGFTPIMGCFLGVAMKKYLNPVISITLGEFLMYLIINGLITLGVDASIQDFVQGVVLVIVVCLTMRSSRYAEVR